MPYKIIHKTRLNSVMAKMVINAPYVASNAKAGNFIVLRIDEKGERIPLTINDSDPESGTVTIIFQEAGATTQRLGTLSAGDTIIDIDGKIKWKKPISCHLFPIITKESKRSDSIYVNYEPREDHCKAACTFGKKLKVPVYVFLKEALTRKFGKKFYSALEATANHLNTQKP